MATAGKTVLKNFSIWILAGVCCLIKIEAPESSHLFQRSLEKLP
jgi:hypothetical protein